MIWELSFKNFFSFKDEAVLSMVEWKNIKKDELNENFIKLGEWKERLLKTTVIYWPNASWKSTILRVVCFLKNLVLNSHRFNPKERFDSFAFPQESRLSTFLLDKKSREKPTEISISFISHKNIQYQYSLKLNLEKILEEKLVWYHTSKPINLITRKNWKIEFDSRYFNRGKWLISEIRENQLALSVCADKNIEEAIDVYDYFKKIYVFMWWIQNEFDTNEMLNRENNMEFQKFLLKLVQKADFSVNNFYHESKDILFKELPLNIQKLYRSFSQFEIKDDSKILQNNDYFSHAMYENKKFIWEYNMPLDYESMGTKEIFKVAGTIYNVMKENYVLFWDEFDKSLHPDLTRNIIETIHSSNIWWQFILNTHDTSLLDTKSLFRRDQIRFVEKNQYWASSLYSLLEFKERSNQDVEKQYLKWRYWAIPSFSWDSLF